MKLHNAANAAYQTVTAYDEKGVEINAVRYERSLLVMPELAPVEWPVTSFDQLSEQSFAQLAALQPDVVLLGTGERQRFVHPSLSRTLTGQGVGVECMDNKAACRTYNILMGEGRKVALALIIA